MPKDTVGKSGSPEIDGMNAKASLRQLLDGHKTCSHTHFNL